MNRCLPIAFACAALLAAAPIRAANTDQADTIAYLGVATSPVEPMLARHLKLRPGTGLLVQVVDEKSAAHGMIEVEDILTELDGQLLINPDQFVTLVRLQKPGQQVTIKLRREGTEKTIQLKLGERAAPDEQEEAADAWNPLFRAPRDWFDMQNRTPTPARPRRDGGQLRLKQDARAGTHVEMHSTSVVERDGMRAELTDDGSSRRFKVTDEKGKTLFDGPVNDDDVKKMSPEVRDLYNELGGNTKVEIHRAEPRAERGDPATRIDT